MRGWSYLLKHCVIFIWCEGLDYTIINPVNTPVLLYRLNSTDSLSINFKMRDNVPLHYFRKIDNVLPHFFSQIPSPETNAQLWNCCCTAHARHAHMCLTTTHKLINYQTPATYTHSTYITNVPYHISVTDLIWFPTHSYFCTDQNIRGKVQLLFSN